MKLFGIYVVKWKEYDPPIIVARASDLTSMNFLRAKLMKRSMKAAARALARSCRPGDRLVQEEKQFKCYAQSRSDGLAGVLFADQVSQGVPAVPVSVGGSAIFFDCPS